MPKLKTRLVVIEQMNPAGKKIGGIATCIKDIIRYAPDDFEISFVGASSRADKIPAGKWQKLFVYGREIDFLPVLRVPDENKRGIVPLSLRFSLALLRYRTQISGANTILHFHRIEPALPLKGLPGKKLLFIHGNMMDLYNPHTEVKWKISPRLYFWLEKRVIKKMDAVYVVRQDGVELYHRRYPDVAQRISFLPVWANEEIFYPPKDPQERMALKNMLLRERGLSADTKLILFVGRLEGQKNPLLLIDTLYEITQQVPEAHLLIVGTGGLKGQMEKRIAQYNLEKKVSFTGILAQEKVAQLMRLSDILLLTSAFEGMPRTVLEALRCGLPVVSTDAGETKRVVKDGISGFICREHDAAALAGNVRRVLQENTILADNCVKVVEDYTASNVLRNVYAACRSVAK